MKHSERVLKNAGLITEAKKGSVRENALDLIAYYGLVGSTTIGASTEKKAIDRYGEEAVEEAKKIMPEVAKAQAEIKKIAKDALAKANRIKGLDHLVAIAGINALYGGHHSKPTKEDVISNYLSRG